MRTYKLLTSDQMRLMLKQRIEELEQQHWMAEINLAAARAVAEATPEAATQRSTSEQEAESLERSAASLGAAIDALAAKLEEAELRVGRPKPDNNPLGAANDAAEAESLLSSRS